ncbi:ParA family protein [Paenibacillus rigui]|uniref:AAA domain-containing protein n=1 Tax=Paenibacillus rigui TaxID=554312 RepID=A0A229UWT2_9BACL|nr:ParA family protein [Paenibacillus rigui]OXM87888.1 hypothetical protein CF651_01915 [Paenibacillus rigui]
MGKMRLVVVDEDPYFIEMFSAYIRSSEYGQTFTFTAFSIKERGFAFIDKAVEPYILLVHEGLMPLPDKVFQQQLGCLILLSDTAAATDILEYPVLCKYQPLNLLLSHMISHYNEYSSKRMITGNRASQVISLYSAAGGTGKTLTAVHLARELVMQGRKVFYLNLEQLPSLSWMEPGEAGPENHLARMLYYGKTDPKLQMARIERYKRKHRVMGFDYFPGGFEPKEVEHMSEQDTETLIHSIWKSGAYDYLLIDLDSCMVPRVNASLNQSDRIIWLALDDRIHLDKLKLRWRQWGEGSPTGAGKGPAAVQLIVNKFNGSLRTAATEWPLPIAGYLPYIPEWKACGTVENVQIRCAFSEKIAEWPWVTSTSAKEKAHGLG